MSRFPGDRTLDLIRLVHPSFSAVYHIDHSKMLWLYINIVPSVMQRLKHILQIVGSWVENMLFWHGSDHRSSCIVMPTSDLLIDALLKNIYNIFNPQTHTVSPSLTSLLFAHSHNFFLSLKHTLIFLCTKTVFPMEEDEMTSTVLLAGVVNRLILWAGIHTNNISGSDYCP